jgi:hypothetical protein
VTDIPTILKGEYEEDFQRQQNQTLREVLSVNGWTLPPLTNAEVAIVTSYTFERVMPFGTQWANSDLGKMQFITIPADPDTLTNATIETITSV